jgi:hypothetical protein
MIELLTYGTHWTVTDNIYTTNRSIPAQCVVHIL